MFYRSETKVLLRVNFCTMNVGKKEGATYHNQSIVSQKWGDLSVEYRLGECQNSLIQCMKRVLHNSETKGYRLSLGRNNTKALLKSIGVSVINSCKSRQEQNYVLILKYAFYWS